MKQINDPVFGELEYDKSKKGWTKKIPLGIWGAVYNTPQNLDNNKGAIKRVSLQKI